MLIVIVTCFIVALSAPILYKAIGKYVFIPMAILPFTIFGYLCTLLPDILAGKVVVQTYNWVPTLGINLQFRLDGLSMVFALIISFFGGLIMLYASDYLKDHPLLGRFYLYLTLFMAAMLGIVTSDNIIGLFIFWEITSISSFLLIGFDNNNEKARTSAWQALLVTGFGGLALMASLILVSIATNSYTFTDLLSHNNGFTQHPLYVPALILLLLGCFTKSAQVPFHFWLPNAMAAPTPVSAYLHSATMVKAGIYLLARVEPIFSGTELWLITLIVIGGATALFGAFMALQQTDLKAILAYTTISALGLMVTMIGIGTIVALKAMLVFLLAHALYKGTMFLVAGAIDHSTGTREINKLNGLARHMPVTAIATSLAALSMAGLMPFFGFIGKELLYEAALESSFFARLVFGLTFFTGVAFVAVAAIFSYGLYWEKVFEPTNVEHSPTFFLYVPPFILGFLGVALGLSPKYVVTPLIERAIQSITGSSNIEIDLSLWHGFTLELGMSVVTIIIGVILYLNLKHLQKLTLLLDSLYKFGPNNLYHKSFKGFLVFAKKLTSIIQDGNLRRYIIYIVLFFSLIMLYVLWYEMPGIDFSNRLPLFQKITFYEVVLFVLVPSALFYLLGTRSRITSVVIMGLVGYSAALIYILYGAPDVAATQLLIETLTVVIFVLLLHKLPAFIYLSHQFKKYTYIGISILFGAVMTYIMFLVQDHAVESKLKEYYGKASYLEAHGRNIVNVILVDFRGLDTLGEITVLAVAALGIYALLRLQPEKGDKL